jgi:hypothetical protein
MYHSAVFSNTSFFVADNIFSILGWYTNLTGINVSYEKELDFMNDRILR